MSPRSSAVQYDPHVDIDWESPWQSEDFALPPDSVTLHGTRLWARLAQQDKRTLALHEAVSRWSTVAYLTAMLTGNQLRRAAEEGLNSAASRNAFDEVAGSSRTTITFGRLVRATDVAPYKPPRGTTTAVKLLGFLPLGAASHASTLLVEETFSRSMAAAVTDPGIEPHVRQAVKIHRLESADRFAFARSEVVAAQSKSNAVARAYNRVLLAVLANVILRLGVSFEVYRSIGIGPVRGAFASRRRRAEIRRRDSANTVAFLQSAGMLDGTVTAALWRLTGVVPPNHRP
ncbi:diiron oxygenase [Rhodococcus cercidiphylli]|uniref:Diiron oxygenase n=1 Tax=Rhodococcus cercidiphylli TaxID=489916 RepID=A0ABU4AXU4_9NOCA|nr:diiron oxygenase [Rhodococcus cercidiphylli]MDV6231057.1 diiron oxygenase [Rhodococcus cercidiphylli]